MVELVTRMMELKKQQARAPKKQSPSARQLLDQKLAITDQQIDALVCELYGLTEEELRTVEEEAKRETGIWVASPGFPQSHFPIDLGLARLIIFQKPHPFWPGVSGS